MFTARNYFQRILSVPMYFRLMERWFSSNKWLVELSLFHDKRGPVWSAVKILTDALNDQKIDYALVGGLAVYKHGYKRTTSDCDILVSKADVTRFEDCLVGRYIRPKFKGAKRKFICNETKTPIDIIIQGEYPGKGVEIPVSFPAPETCTQLIDGVKVITLPKLIELKLASYKSLPSRRITDKADVTKLIECNNLNREFAALLHPYIQDEFIDIIVGNEKDDMNMIIK